MQPSNGDAFRRRVAGMGIAEVICSPASPWQNPYAERVIGSIRRECLDHVIVFGEAHLRRLISAYFAYYHRERNHQGLENKLIETVLRQNEIQRLTSNTDCKRSSVLRASSKGFAIAIARWRTMMLPRIARSARTNCERPFRGGATLVS